LTVSPQAVALLKRRDQAVQNLKRTAAADDVIPYYDVWTYAPVLDSVYVARALENTLTDLLRIDDAPLESRFVTPQEGRKVGHAVPATYALSRPYVDPDTKLFRIHEADRPSIYAIDSGLRLLVDAVTLEGLHEDLLPVVADIVRSCGRLLKREVDNRTPDLRVSTPSAVPYGVPSVFGAYSALSAINSYSVLASTLGDLPKLTVPYDLVVSALTQDAFIYRERDVLAFKRATSTDGCVTTTYYAYRVAALLGSAGSPGAQQAFKILDGFLRRHASRLLRFVESCFSDGGFAANPGQSRSPSLGETRYALELIACMLEWGHINDKTRLARWLDPEPIINFVERCWLPQSQGFGNLPNDEAATICSMRAATSCVRLLEAFRRFGDIQSVSPQYSQAVSRVTHHLKDSASEFISSCTDRESNESYAYPIELVTAWKDTRRELSRDLCRDAFVDRLPSCDRELAPFFREVCTEHTTPEYLRNRKDCEFRIRQALIGDLRELCYLPVHKRSLAFRRTKREVGLWPRPHLELTQLPEKVMGSLTEARIVERVDGKWRLRVPADIVPTACSVLQTPERDSDPAVQVCDRIREAIHSETDALPTADGVLESVKQLLRRKATKSVNVFAQTPWVLLPEAYYATPAEFLHVFGWQDAADEQSSYTGKFMQGYARALRDAAAAGIVHYQWNQREASAKLRRTYERAPGEKRLTYISSAIRLLSTVLETHGMTASCYQPVDEPDLREWLYYVDDEHLILAFRHPETLAIVNGLRLSRQFFSDICRSVYVPGADLSHVGAILLRNWWQESDQTFATLGQLVSEAGHVASAEVASGASVEERARAWIVDHLMNSADQRHAGIETQRDQLKRTFDLFRSEIGLEMETSSVESPSDEDVARIEKAARKHLIGRAELYLGILAERNKSRGNLGAEDMVH
jgi:hypothetical protein